MKRKLIIVVLSVALTLTLIPTLAAYANEMIQNETPILEDVQGDVDGPDAALEEEEGDLDEEEAVEVELPKINLKSPVTQMSESDKGSTYTLVARVGEKVIDPTLVSWSSDNEAVATVSLEGVVTIIGVGKANITAVMIDPAIARDGHAKVFVAADKEKKVKKAKKQK
jgi:hypothetical protein